MYNIIIVRHGEIGVKGKNKYIFENKLVKNIKNSLKELGKLNVYKDHGRIYIDVEGHDYESIINESRKVFGVVSVSPGIKLEKDYDALKKACRDILNEKIDFNEIKTFKVTCKRGDKDFHLTSPQMSRDIGGYLLSHFGNEIGVDVHNPQLMVEAEMRQDCAIAYVERYDGFGGLPLGTNGRALSLLSGGIDSPVSTWLVAKRGVDIEVVHYHSYPFTSEKAKDKVVELTRILSKYCGNIIMHSINILAIQKEINKNCKEEEMTIISRRFMMRIAQEVAKKRYCDALITGESIGQVASQTIQGLTATNSVVGIPVFRPVISMDKTEIVTLAKKIGTYETSIIPEEDCCTVFLPKNPLTKPRVDRLELAESHLDVDGLIKEAIDNMISEEIEF